MRWFIALSISNLLDVRIFAEQIVPSFDMLIFSRMASGDSVLGVDSCLSRTTCPSMGHVLDPNLRIFAWWCFSTRACRYSICHTFQNVFRFSVADWNHEYTYSSVSVSADTAYIGTFAFVVLRNGAKSA